MLDLTHGLVEDIGIKLLNNLVCKLLITLIHVLCAEIVHVQTVVVLGDSVIGKLACSLLHLLGIENVELFQVLLKDVLELSHLHDLLEFGIVDLAELNLEVFLNSLRHDCKQCLLELLRLFCDGLERESHGGLLNLGFIGEAEITEKVIHVLVAFTLDNVFLLVFSSSKEVWEESRDLGVS